MFSCLLVTKIKSTQKMKFKKKDVATSNQNKE